MQKFFLLAILSLSLIACDRNDKPRSGTYPDNTGINVRDRDAQSKTPLDQSESETDRAVTQRIRQMVMSDDSLSTNAKNIKIITINGVVTLRGPVLNAQEKEKIARKVSDIQGLNRVENQLEVTDGKY